MKTPPPNPRPLEPRLAPRFHEVLLEHPPSFDRPHTQARAEALLADALKCRASDIHIEPSVYECRLRFRVDGVLHDVATLPVFSGRRLTAFFKIQSQIDSSVLPRPEHGHARMMFDDLEVEMRTTIAPTPAGEMAGIRLLDPQHPFLPLSELGMAAEDQALLREWMAGMQGMLIVCGPVGSGKTSTLYSVLHELQGLPRSIVTVEDPVECHMDGITQIEVNAKRGLLFPEAIHAMLRLDPDYLLVGEIRDAESAHVAVTAAGSGHALLSTLHARGAMGAVTALRNQGLKNWEIAAALEICVAQHLVRRLCPQCRVAAATTAEEREWFARHGVEAPAELYAAKGCDACAHTGYVGRIGLFELWRLNARSHQLILNGAEEIALAHHALQHGLRPLVADALAKTAAGITSLAEVRGLASGALHASTALASKAEAGSDG